MAIIGTVTYPTDTSWEVEIVDVTSSANTFLVSDGTDTIAIDVEGSGPANLEISASFGISTEAVDLYYIPRNMSVGRSWVAGPYVYVDFPQGSTKFTARLGITPSSDFTANWSEAESLAQSFGFNSLSSFAAIWSQTARQASAHGISFDSGYFTPDRVSTSLAQTFGFESESSFSGALNSAQAVVSRLGFNSLSSFLAIWEEASTFGVSLGLSLQAAYVPPDAGNGRFQARFGITSEATFRAKAPSGWAVTSGGMVVGSGQARPIVGSATSTQIVVGEAKTSGEE